MYVYYYNKLRVLPSVHSIPKTAEALQTRLYYITSVHLTGRFMSTPSQPKRLRQYVEGLYLRRLERGRAHGGDPPDPDVAMGRLERGRVG